MVDVYRYYLTQRPPSLGTHPKGACNIVSHGKKIDGVWGYVEYRHPLTDKQIRDYELKGIFGMGKVGIENSFRRG